MARQRAPWWMYLVAASFLVYFATLVYAELWRPRWTGAVLLHKGGRIILGAVEPNSPAGRAGLRPGDRVLAVDGHAIHSETDWMKFYLNRQIGRSYRFEVERVGERQEVTLTLKRRPGDHWGLFYNENAPQLVVQLELLILALVIAFSRPYDLVARVGACFLAAVASVTIFTGGEMIAIWRHLPRLLGGLLWIPHIIQEMLLPLLFTFFAIFPRKLFRARWPWLLVWTPIFVLSVWWTRSMYDLLYRLERFEYQEWLVLATGLSALVYIGGGLTALVLNYRRLDDINERRRARVLVVGSVVGWLAILPTVYSHYSPLSTSPEISLAKVFISPPVRILASVVFLAFPLSIAYGILRHRLFDIRVVIRQGLHYALARGLVLSLVPGLGAALLVDLLVHGDQPLVAILRARGWVYGVLGGLALTIFAQRQRWLEALDRRFFRERYDARRLLREVAEELHRAGSLERAAPRAVARIEAALHPEFAALMKREPGALNYRSLAAAPAGQAPPPLPVDSKLIALLRVLGKPLDASLTESSWLLQQLPPEEADMLRRARIDLVVPVVTAPERTEALLVMGPKRSEEPYTREDQDLLVTIATNLAVLLEKPVEQPMPASRAFEECPQCGACYDTGLGRCTREGATLAIVQLPRLLAGRYRIERRLGRGGMGTVYEATDAALERRVAVKVMRDELAGSADAAERFRREARASAAFAHPNAVTVYDFGLEGTRAFLVMELLQGTALREELRRQMRLPAPRTIEILRGVCAAVGAAHRRPLIHRDLKPANIFLCRGEARELAKVLDFGVAKFLPSDTDSTLDTGTGIGQLVGTLHYMAPEQLRGQAAGVAWDLWALAVVAYEMLTGARPFAGPTPAELHSAILAGRFPAVAAHLPEAPTEWQEFFARAFALEPERRFDSTPTFFSELERALAQRATSAASGT